METSLDRVPPHSGALAALTASAGDLTGGDVRRKFYDIAQGSPSPIAAEALRRIAVLYEIEAEIRGQSAAARRAVRQDRTKPVVEALKVWLLERLAEVSGKSVIAGAIRYALGLWDGLIRFLDDGRVEIDSNTVERSMRPIALNRKNALFAGCDEGGENWALLASLIETCKLNGVNPQAWLTDVLTRLVNNWPNSRLDELMPWAWSAAKAMLANPDIGVTQIAHRLGVSPATLYRYIPAARTANTPSV